MSFEAEAINSGGEKFATFKVDASSLHYPAGVVYWGADSGSIQSTDTGAPFPVQVFGNTSAAPFFVRGVGDSTIPVSGTVTINALTSASKIQTEPVTSSANATFVNNNSAHPVFVRGVGDSALPVSGTVTINALTSASKIQIEPVTSSANATFVNNNSATQLYVRADSNNPVFVRDENSTTVTVTGYVAPSTTQAISSVSGVVSVEPTSSAAVHLRTTAAANGMVTSEINLSSLAQTIMTASGMFYGWSLSNESTSANIWVKVFPEDSGGVTLGTTSPKFNVMIPFGGGREAFFPTGIPMSSGMSVAAAATAASTAHDAPSSTGWATIFYDPSS